jgi:hypothetical protein
VTADGVVEESGVDLVVEVFAGEFFDGHPFALQAPWPSQPNGNGLFSGSARVQVHGIFRARSFA